MKIKPLVGGISGALLAATGLVVVGGVSGVEARVLLEAIMPSARFLCSSVMTSAATILALLLTGLGFARGIDVDLKPKTYSQIRQIALVDSVALIGAVFALLVLLIVPLQETEMVPQLWYSVVYYSVIGANAILGGLIISIVLMLYETIKGLTLLVGSGDSPLRKVEDEEGAD